MKILKRLILVIVCVPVFLVVFAVSVFVRFSALTGIDASGFTLQGAAADAARYEGGIRRETIDVPYITDEGTVETRQLLLYRPAEASGDLPLIYIPPLRRGGKHGGLPVLDGARLGGRLARVSGAVQRRADRE